MRDCLCGQIYSFYHREGCSFDAERAYLFKVQGVGALLVKILPADSGFVYAAPFDDIPEELRPEAPACTGATGEP